MFPPPSRAHRNFYPRPPRGGRPLCCLYCQQGKKISIHALREEGDLDAWRETMTQHRFLSTPSARRATNQKSAQSRSILNFYPRPPRGGRPGAHRHSGRYDAISIHALREEGDPQTQPSRAWASRISIHALREEGDRRGGQTKGGGRISIHALREEGDKSSCTER